MKKSLCSSQAAPQISCTPTIDDMIQYVQEAIDMSVHTIEVLKENKDDSDVVWMIRSTEDVQRMEEAILKVLEQHKKNTELVTRPPAEALAKEGNPEHEVGAGDDYPVIVIDNARALEFPPKLPPAIQSDKAEKFQKLENKYRNGC